MPDINNLDRILNASMTNYGFGYKTWFPIYNETEGGSKKINLNDLLIFGTKSIDIEEYYPILNKLALNNWSDYGLYIKRNVFNWNYSNFSGYDLRSKMNNTELDDIWIGTTFSDSFYDWVISDFLMSPGNSDNIVAVLIGFPKYYDESHLKTRYETTLYMADVENEAFNLFGNLYNYPKAIYDNSITNECIHVITASEILGYPIGKGNFLPTYNQKIQMFNMIRIEHFIRDLNDSFIWLDDMNETGYALNRYGGVNEMTSEKKAYPIFVIYV